MSVAVVFAVRLVVLVVVGDEIVQGEAIVGRDEVDRGPGFAATLGEQVGGRSKARGKLRQFSLITPPVGPDRVPISIVPFGPARREPADLVAARSQIPRFGDQLDLR